MKAFYTILLSIITTTVIQTGHSAELDTPEPLHLSSMKTFDEMNHIKAKGDTPLCLGHADSLGNPFIGKMTLELTH